MSGYPVLGAVPVTVAAMRAAADLLETAGIAGLSVTCTDNQISIQVTEWLGDAHARAGIVARLAELLNTRAYQDDSPTTASSWLRGCGQVNGISTHVFTPLPVPTTTGEATGPALAVTGDGEHVEVQPGHRLPAGWRWATELDITLDQLPDQEVA